VRQCGTLIEQSIQESSQLYNLTMRMSERIAVPNNFVEAFHVLHLPMSCWISFAAF